MDFCLGVGDWSDPSLGNSIMTPCLIARRALSIAAIIATLLAIVIIVGRLILSRPKRRARFTLVMACLALLFLYFYLTGVVWADARIREHTMLVVAAAIGVALESFTVGSILNDLLHTAFRLVPCKNATRRMQVSVAIKANYVTSLTLSVTMFIGFLIDGLSPVEIAGHAYGLRLAAGFISAACVVFLTVHCFATRSISEDANDMQKLGMTVEVGIHVAKATRSRANSTVGSPPATTLPTQPTTVSFSNVSLGVYEDIKQRMRRQRICFACIFVLALLASTAIIVVPTWMTLLLPLLSILAALLNVIYTLTTVKYLCKKDRRSSSGRQHENSSITTDDTIGGDDGDGVGCCDAWFSHRSVWNSSERKHKSVTDSTSSSSAHSSPREATISDMRKVTIVELVSTTTKAEAVTAAADAEITPEDGDGGVSDNDTATSAGSETAYSVQTMSLSV